MARRFACPGNYPLYSLISPTNRSPLSTSPPPLTRPEQMHARSVNLVVSRESAPSTPLFCPSVLSTRIFHNLASDFSRLPPSFSLLLLSSEKERRKRSIRKRIIPRVIFHVINLLLLFSPCKFVKNMDLGWIEIEDSRYPFEGSPLCFVEGSCVLSRVVSYFAHVARFLFPLSLYTFFLYAYFACSCQSDRVRL